MFPQNIIHRFNRLALVKEERNQYMCSWSCILYFCFEPTDEHYYVTLFYSLDCMRGSEADDEGDDSRKYVSYGVTDDDENLLLFLEIKEPSALSGNPAAQEIDEEMRWLCTQVQERAAPVMYAVSAIGPRFRVYRFEKEAGKISAPPSTSSLSKGGDEASPVSVESWNEDICSPDGYTRFMELINNVKEIAAKVPASKWLEQNPDSE